MRRFLIAFGVLSILVMAQNVVAGMAVTLSSERLTEAVGQPAGLASTAASTPVGGATPKPTPKPISQLLLVAGLSGLAAVGNRGGHRRQSDRS
jgi:hypothetical protein